MPSKKQQSELPLAPANSEPAPSGAANGAHSAIEERGAIGERGALGESKAEMSFEDSIERLSEIVEALESAGLPLEESLKLFEEGVQLARKSQARLDTAERKVQELLAYDDSGKPIVEEFDPE